MTNSYLPCFLIPCYNHGSTVPEVINALVSFNLPIILVDDGSMPDTKEILRRVVLQSEQATNDNDRLPAMTLVTLQQNQGKGGAVIAGLKEAQRQGYSHCIQIDADGQHDTQALPRLLEQSRAHPNKLISGQPIYDDTVPKSRLYGRYITHVWVWIETLSLSIKDSMCGFRSYPVAKTVDVINSTNIGKRMDFDIEILVRMYWQGVDIDYIPTKVIYPEGGISHFDAVADNIKISKMHCKLFFGMLPRIPRLLLRKVPSLSLNQDTQESQNTNQTESCTNSSHWSRHSEKGSIIGMRILLTSYSLLGRSVFSLMLRVVMAYYYLFGKQARKASQQYLAQLEQYAIQNAKPVQHKLTSYRHLLSFGHTMLDKLAAWKGDIRYQDLTIHGLEVFEQVFQQKQGVILLGSHLGNIELCRALSRTHTELKINALVFTKHAERFNTIMRAVNPNSDLNLIQVNELGPETAILLQQKLEQGEWIVIVGDRTSTTHTQRAVWVDFLGQKAPFPQGPFMLASILKAPVFLLFGLRDESQKQPHFNVYFERFSKQIILPRAERESALQTVVEQYAKRLQHYTLQAPLQWYNFFNFWKLSDTPNDQQNQK